MSAVLSQETPKQAARRLAQPAIREGFEPFAIFEYTDAEGAPIYWRIRLRHPTRRKPDGKPEKWVRPMRNDGERYSLGEPDFSSGKPLYGLMALTEKPDAPVVVVEGENKVEGLARLGIVATTSGSATSAGATDWQPLAGRKVTIWPDNDAPGRDYCEDVRRILLGLGASVSVIDAAALGLGESEDAIDWLAAHPGATAADVDALPRIAPAGEPVTTVGQADDWPEPKPLPDALPPVPAFEFAMLPDSLRPWIADIALRVQCPPDFVAVAAMVALSAVVGRKIGIRPKRRDDWYEVANLWCAIVGNPSMMKSPAMREAMRLLNRIAAKAFEEYEAEAEAFGKRQAIAKLQRKVSESAVLKALKKGGTAAADALAGDDEEAEPQPRRYVVNDTSVEALGEVLRFNPNGVLAYRDELIGLLKSLDKEGNESARSFYLSAWNGKESYTFDRIMRGMNLRIDACCLSLLGSIQPAVIGDYLRQAINENGGDGLLSRFQLLVWPDPVKEWRSVDQWPDTPARQMAAEVFERLDTLDPLAIGATGDEDAIPCLRYDDAAYELFIQWQTELIQRNRRGEDHPAIEAHLTKYQKLVPALSLLIHLADNGGAQVGEPALLKALAWAEYLEAHARRAYASVTNAQAEGARTLLRRIRKGDIADDAGKALDVFAARDVYRRGWSHLGTPEAFYEAAKMLCDFDYLREEVAASGPKGGAPKQAYRVNPKARKA